MNLLDLPLEIVDLIFSSNEDILPISQQLCSLTRILLRKKYLKWILLQPVKEKELRKYLEQNPKRFALYDQSYHNYIRVTIFDGLLSYRARIECGYDQDLSLYHDINKIYVLYYLDLELSLRNQIRRYQNLPYEREWSLEGVLDSYRKGLMIDPLTYLRIVKERVIFDQSIKIHSLLPKEDNTLEGIVYTYSYYNLLHRLITGNFQLTNNEPSVIFNFSAILTDDRTQFESKEIPETSWRQQDYLHSCQQFEQMKEQLPSLKTEVVSYLETILPSRS